MAWLDIKVLQAGVVTLFFGRISGSKMVFLGLSVLLYYFRWSLLYLYATGVTRKPF